VVPLRFHGTSVSADGGFRPVAYPHRHEVKTKQPRLPSEIDATTAVLNPSHEPKATSSGSGRYRRARRPRGINLVFDARAGPSNNLVFVRKELWAAHGGSCPRAFAAFPFEACESPNPSLFLRAAGDCAHEPRHIRVLHDAEAFDKTVVFVSTLRQAATPCVLDPPGPTPSPSMWALMVQDMPPSDVFDTPSGINTTRSLLHCDFR